MATPDRPPTAKPADPEDPGAARCAQSVVALVTDLIFASKIQATARAVGVVVDVVRDLPSLRAAVDRSSPALALIDLNGTAIDPCAAIAELKAQPRPPRVVAYVSHVDADRAAAGRRAGADEILARSAFSTRLPELLAGSPR